MEIGIGLIVGVGVGLLAGLLIVVAGRKKRQETAAGKNAESAKPSAAPPVTDRRRPTTTVGVGKTATAETASSNTKVVPAERSGAKSETRSKPAPGNGVGAAAPTTAEREAQLGVMMTEMRELILQLAEIVGKTDSASGEAEGRIANIKGNLDRLKITDNAALSEAKAMLLGEVDRMAKTNAALKQQLNEAQNGIANQRAQIEELQSTVRIDFLTKLPNRTAFDERLNEALYRYNRMSEPFSLLMLDIDYFKNVNDTYGHVNGDRVLKGVAMKIKEAIRTDDFAARYGGEEFVVILPNTVDKVALGVAERLRESIERTKFRLDDKTINITISGGIAQCSTGIDTDTIVDSSDKALYKAKVEGRNRILIYRGGKTNTAVDKYRKEHHVRSV